jgi:putative membrane protein
MAKDKKRVTVIVCVDRDNDLGKKTGIEGPVVGRDANLDAATKLVLADPQDSDANCIFAAVKKYDELSQELSNVELVTLTGYSKLGFKSDKRINEQLEMLTKQYSIDGFILVTDGAEDDQVIPLLQNYGKIISKELVIVKQSKQMESMYYTLKAVITEPEIARLIFGIPGVLLIFSALTLFFGVQHYFLQGVLFIAGLYLVLKGFDLEQSIFALFGDITSSVSEQRASFPFYTGSLFLIVFALITYFNDLAATAQTMQDVVVTAQNTYFFFVLALLFFIFGRAIDCIHRKQAFYLRRYVLYAFSTLLVWLMVDAATLVFLQKANLDFFLIAVLCSFLLLLVAFRVSSVLDVQKRLVRFVVGMPVYDRKGAMLGTVRKVNKKKGIVFYSLAGEGGAVGELRKLRFTDFKLSEGKLVLR